MQRLGFAERAFEQLDETGLDVRAFFTERTRKQSEIVGSQSQRFTQLRVSKADEDTGVRAEYLVRFVGCERCFLGTYHDATRFELDRRGGERTAP